MSVFQFNGLILLVNIFVALLNILLGMFFLKKIKELNHKEHEIDKSFSKIVEHAHAKSEALLEAAAEKASAIIKETKTLKVEMDHDLQLALKESVRGHMTLFDEVSKRVTLSYAEIFKNMRQEFLAHMDQVNDKVKQLAEDNLNTYRAIIKDEASTAQLSIQQKIDEEFAKAKKDIEAYRANEISYIDKSIGKIILQISKDIIGREINLIDQQNLLFEALDRAKKEGVFNH